MGASLAGFIGAVPWVTSISDYKKWIFAGAGVMLALAVFMHWSARDAPCPVDPNQAKVCMMIRKICLGILIFSIMIYLIGFFFAFLAADLFFVR